MKNFLLGFFWGSGNYNDESGGNETSIIGILIFLLVGYMAINGVAVFLDLTVKELFSKLIKVGSYYMYPSMWDYYHHIAEGHNGLKAWIMVGNALIITIIGGIPAIMVLLVFKNEVVGEKVSLMLFYLLAFPNLFWVIFRFLYYLVKGIFL